MAAKAVASKGIMLLGQCVPCVKQSTSKIKVKTLEMDKFLNMYFSKFEFVYAHDPMKMCKTGDIVLVRQMPKKLTTLITHEVMRVVYPLGDITDPVTGKKTVYVHYRDEEDQVVSLYGSCDGRFQYEEAPPRGWQEDKKDLTHRESYAKYNEDGTDQKYAL